MGLSIVHKLVTLLEGSISVQSTLGEGSRFIVILPLYPVGPVVGEKQEEAVVSTSVSDQAGDREEISSQKLNHVLLIDDDRIQLALTAAMLEQQNIRATCCQQPDELIEQLRTSSFDVLLTDVQMPAINGFDLLKLLRASNILRHVLSRLLLLLHVVRWANRISGNMDLRDVCTNLLR